jgi:hypothetical protein
MHFYTWKTGLKTGCYYLRTKAPTMAQKFTVDPRLLAAVSGGGPVKQEDDDAIPDSDDEEEASASAAKQAELKAKNKRELLDKLTAEYEESVAKAKAEAESGEGCLMCSG